MKAKEDRDLIMKKAGEISVIRVKFNKVRLILIKLVLC